MKRTVLLATALAGVLLLAACSGNGGSAESSASSELTLPSKTTAEATTAAAPSTPNKNARGNLVKAFGEQGGFGHPETGDDMVSWAVDEVVVDLPCTAPYYNYQPENGHIVGLRFRVSTGADLTPLGSFFTISDQDFAFIGPDGITHTNVYSISAYACLPPTEQFTSDPLGPGQQYVGTIVLDVPGTTGTIVYKPAMAEGGWEWNF